MNTTAAGFAVFALSLSACGADLQITTSGGDVVEDGIGEAAFVDGGRVLFSKFLIAFGDIEVSVGDGSEGTGFAPQQVFDVQQAGPHDVTVVGGLESRRYEDLRVVVGAASEASANVNADDTDFDAMKAAGASLAVGGTVTHDGVSKTFDWAFTTQTRYQDCRLQDTSVGVVVPGQWELTVHGGRLFRDRLDDDADLRSAAVVAADDNDDGDVSLDELSALTLPGDYAGDVDTLGAFVIAQTRGLVHHSGNGSCVALKL